jgi:hypothetical protein
MESTMPGFAIDRRTFLRNASGLLAVAALDPVPRKGMGVFASRLEHPDPRPGITAEHVLTAEALGTSRKEAVLAAYDVARTYPELFDGLACACGCTGKQNIHRSLLTCFETLQPTGCYGCQEQAQLVAKLAKEEKTLAEIRLAFDKKWG